MPTRDIHIARDGEELGTFTPDEVNELLASGFFKPGDEYWVPGLSDWEAIGEAFKPTEVAPTPPSWLATARRHVVERSSDVATRVGGLMQTVKVGAAEGSRSLSKARQKILEEQLPHLQKLLAAQLKDKPLGAARSALQNDDLMRKIFGALYDCLPKPVCRFIAEEAFVRFCLQHRERLIKPDGQSTARTGQDILPPPERA